jgi:hypothetical protein
LEPLAEADDIDADRVDHPDAPAGKATKYAQVERERRFLLAAPPPGVPTRRTLIEDRYLRGMRLRLRRMTDLDGPAGSVTFKLTQKIPAPDGSPGLITTIYLSAAEYAAFTLIPANLLRKVRLSYPPLGVDVFEGPLDGLVMAEAEFDDPAGEAQFAAPTQAIAEVTTDVRFSGGRLVGLTAADLAELLDAFRIRP